MSTLLLDILRPIPSSDIQVIQPTPKPSPTLSRFRAHIIDDSMPFYEPTMNKMISLINDYVGADEAQEKSISENMTHFSPERLFLAEVQRYKKKRMMTREDRQHAVHWVRTIVNTQRAYAKLLPGITLEAGDSEGATFVISNGERLYGFLYGTMHNFSRGLREAEILTKLSLSTQINLLSCSIIGTEITVKDEPSSHSVEGALMAITDEYGIANIGIDDATCDRAQVGRTCTVVTPGTETFPPKVEAPIQYKELDPIEELISYFEGARDPRTLHRITTIALHSGLIEFAWSAALKEAPDSYQDTLQKRRNQAMAENIDTLLNACKVIGNKSQATPPRCFFALGISHLIATHAIPESVVELVAKKGWTVERLVKEKIQIASSHHMTKREAQYIGESIDHMRKHPLYASQKTCLPSKWNLPEIEKSS